MGSPDFSSGDTNANMEPSADKAMWLTSPGTEMENSILAAEVWRLASSQAAPAPIANASAIAAQDPNGVLRRVFPIRVATLESVPDKALSANDKSFAD